MTFLAFGVSWAEATALMIKCPSCPHAKLVLGKNPQFQ